MIYEVKVDWDHDDTYGHGSSDITGDILRTGRWKWSFGRTGDSSLTDKSKAGVLKLTLINDTGKYSSFNTGSAIAGLILPGRRVRVKMGRVTANVQQWLGRLDTIIPVSEVGKLDVAELTAYGILASVAAGEPRTDREIDILTSDAMDVLLDDISWSAGERDINTGQTTMPYWFFSQAQGTGALKEARKIEDTEMGFIRESKAGKFVFEDRHFRLTGARLTSQVIYSDEGGAGEIGYQRIPQKDPIKSVYNRVVAQAPAQSLGSLAILWTMPATGADSPTIGPGETKRFVAEYPTPDAATEDVGAVWTTLVANTDYKTNSESGGGGTDLTGDMTVSLVKGLDVMVISMTNDHATLLANVTLLQARGQPVQAGNAQKMEEFDQDSIDAYGDREFPIRAKFLPDVDAAVDYARYVIALHKDLAPRPTIRFFANRDNDHMDEAINRDISDRITVKSDSATNLGIDEDFFVERIEHTVIRAGDSHIVTLVVSSAESTAGGIVLDTGPGLDTGYLVV